MTPSLGHILGCLFSTPPLGGGLPSCGLSQHLSSVRTCDLSVAGRTLRCSPRLLPPGVHTLCNPLPRVGPGPGNRMECHFCDYVIQQAGQTLLLALKESAAMPWQDHVTKTRGWLFRSLEEPWPTASKNTEPLSWKRILPKPERA